MNFKNLKKKKREGFTLVEMVIVVTILGILSGIGFMKFGEVQDRSKKNADYAAAASLATAANLYINDYPEEIKYETNGNTFNVSLEVLKSKGYINSIPKSQSQRDDFNITMKKIGENDSTIVEEISIESNGIKFYPKEDIKKTSDGDKNEIDDSKE